MSLKGDGAYDLQYKNKHEAMNTTEEINKDSIKDIWDKHNKVLAYKHMEHKWDELPELCRECKDWAIIGEERFDEKGIPVKKNYSHKNEMLK